MKNSLSILLLLLLLLGRGLSADSFKPTDQDKEELKLMLAVNTHLMTFAKELEQAETSGPLSEDLLESRLRETTKKVLREFDPDHKNPRLIEQAWNLLKKLNWKALAGFVKHNAHSAKKLFHRDGAIVGSAFGLGVVLEFAIPAALLKVGLAPLIAVSAFIPYEFILLSPAYAAKRKWMELQFQKSYGGRKNYLEVKHNYQIMRQSLHLNNMKDILYPVIKGSETNELAVVSSPSFLRKWAENLGLASKGLSYNNLDQFLKRAHINDPLIEALRQDKSLDAQIKAVLLLRLISNHPNPGLLAKLRIEYPSSFANTDVHAFPQELMHSAKEINSAKSIEEGLNILRDLPSHLSAKLVARFIEQVFIPVITNNDPNVRARHVSALLKWSHELIAKAGLDSNISWGTVWKEPVLPPPPKKKAFLSTCAMAFSHLHMSR